MTLAFVLLFQVAAATPRPSTRSSSLTAAAQSSVRPRECVTTPVRPMVKWGPNVWDAAREPSLDRYCDLLAVGFAQLASAPDRALELADRADAASPGRAGPQLLRGRAYANKKTWARALESLEMARTIDPRSLDDPLTLREWARALAHVGRVPESLAVYRTLGPRLSALAPPDDRARTFLEAAELAFAAGPQALDDAVAFLSEAKQLAGRELEWRIGAELALAFDRKGAKDEASGLVVDLARRSKGRVRPLVNPEATDELAASALVLEAINARQACEAWEKYLTTVGERAPFADHARQHLAAMRKKSADAPLRGGIER